MVGGQVAQTEWAGQKTVITFKLDSIILLYNLEGYLLHYTWALAKEISLLYMHVCV